MSAGPQIMTFLMFEGRAEEAIHFYIALFENSRVDEIRRYGAGGMGKEGTVERANFTLSGRPFMAIDSPVKHAFTFTPAISLFVTSTEDSAIRRYFEALSQGGLVLMPLGPYPFSRLFAWVQDRFGVSWQLFAE